MRTCGGSPRCRTNARPPTCWAGTPIGALSDAEASAVDTHIGYCTACLERLSSLDEPADGVMAALRRLPYAAPDAPPALARAVAAAIGGAGLPPAPGLEAGTVLSGYRVVEELGRGGMGRVYRAAHPRLDQEVALKVLRPGLDSAPILARFEAERQALARMDHPHIARVFDGGATADGQPFFAMELVRGVADHALLRRAPPRHPPAVGSVRRPSARPSSTPTRRASSTAT